MACTPSLKCQSHWTVPWEIVQKVAARSHSKYEDEDKNPHYDPLTIESLEVVMDEFDQGLGQGRDWNEEEQIEAQSQQDRWWW